MVWPARAATCNRVLITSAGVTKDAAGIPAANTTRRSLFTFSLYKNNCAFNWWLWKESEASDEIKGLFHCPLRGAPPQLSRVQWRRLDIPTHTHRPFSKLSAYICYIYILSWYWGIIYQWHYFKWWVVQNQWRRSFFFFLCFPTEIRKAKSYLVRFFRGEAYYAFPLRAFLWLLAGTGGASSHTFDHLILQTRTFQLHQRKTWLSADQAFCECVCACVCVLGVAVGVASWGGSHR